MADLDTALREVLTCVCDSLADAGRPTCACYATIGPPIIGTNCCECEAGVTGEATIHFEQMYDADPQTLQNTLRVHPCRNSVTVADATVIVTRCYPTLTEDGELPPPDEVDLAASTMHDDVCVIWKALTCCVTSPMLIRSVAVDSMPEAGCSAIAARVSVEVRC